MAKKYKKNNFNRSLPSQSRSSSKSKPNFQKAPETPKENSNNVSSMLGFKSNADSSKLIVPNSSNQSSVQEIIKKPESKPEKKYEPLDSLDKKFEKAVSDSKAKKEKADKSKEMNHEPISSVSKSSSNAKATQAEPFFEPHETNVSPNSSYNPVAPKKIYRIKLVWDTGSYTVEPNDVVFLGRKNADILLPMSVSGAPTGISKRHALIEETDGHVWIQDLGSSNGTFLNGDRVSTRKVMLRPGDDIRLGIYHLSVRKELVN